MGELVAFLLALIFIWIGWGFWTFLWIFLGLTGLVFILKPKYSWQTHWGHIVGKIGTIVLAFFAIQDKFQNPVITAIAIAVAILLVVLG